MSDLWPVWDDSLINSTKWQDFNLKKSPAFQDSTKYQGDMPAPILVDHWSRPNLSDKNIKWTLSSEDSPLDLMSNNSHLLQYKIMSCIISSFQTLEELGRLKPFEPDGQGASYTYNGGPNWKPWNHIYFMTSAGRGSSHSVYINKEGLYYVRLFHLGYWRRIIVDDFLPYNEKGELLLPCSKNRYNIWPIILSKALLQVALTFDSLDNFSIISCLTGWSYLILNCRNLGINDVWEALQIHYIKDNDNPEGPACFENSERRTTNLKGSQDYKERIDSSHIFALFSKTKNNEVRNLSPCPEHMIGIIRAAACGKNESESLPAWKKMRWFNWAVKHDLKESFCIVKRKLQIYSCSRKDSKPNLYTKENILSLVSKITMNEITNGKLKDIFRAEADNQLTEVTEVVGDVSEKRNILTFDFSTIFPFLRELHIFYRASYYKFSQYFGLKSIKDLSDKSNKGSSTLHSVELPPKTFFLFINSNYSKDILVSLSTIKQDKKSITRPYLTCEAYNWKSRQLGEVLFDLSSFGTVSYMLNMGPNIQVCRFWYKLPCPYYLRFQSNTPFEILTEDILFSRLSVFSPCLLAYSETSSIAFNDIKQAFIRSPDHLALIDCYRRSFYPPGFENMTLPTKMKFSTDFDKMFDDCLAQLIFTEFHPVTSAADVLEVVKVLLNNPKIGERLVDELPDEEKDEYKRAVEMRGKQSNTAYSEDMIKCLDLFRTEHNVNVKDQPITVEIPQEKKQVFRFNAEDVNLLGSPLFNTFLLRNILWMKPEYKSLYPFIGDFECKLVFQEFSGTIDISPIHEWFPITRLLLNVHSKTNVPCYIRASSNFDQVSLLLFDLDISELVTSSPINNVYSISRNKTGYVLLLCGKTTKKNISTPTRINWNIRLAGEYIGDLLHTCVKSPISCSCNACEPLPLSFQNLNGFYLAYSDNIIGRFQIKTKVSPLITMFFSISREDLWFQVIIRGGTSNICVAEGKGSVMIPVLLLDKTTAINSSSEEPPEEYIFKGEIKLIDKWKLNKDERTFLKELKSLSQKDILSWEDFEKLSKEAQTGSVVGKRKASIDESEGLKAAFQTDEESSESSHDSFNISNKEIQSEQNLLTFLPHWKIFMAVEELYKSDIQLQHEDSRVKEFEMFKRLWVENDPDRLKKGEELRNDFLENTPQDILNFHFETDDLSLSDVSECGIEEALELFRKENESKFDFKTMKSMLARFSSKTRSRIDLGSIASERRSSRSTGVERFESPVSPEEPEYVSEEESMSYESLDYLEESYKSEFITLAEIPSVAEFFKKRKPKMSLRGKGIVDILLRQYTNEHQKLNMDSSALHEYLFDLPRKVSEEQLPLKELKLLSKNTDNWDIMKNSIAANLCPITGKASLDDFFSTPKESYSNFMFTKTIENNYLTSKDKADDEINSLQEKLLRRIK